MLQKLTAVYQICNAGLGSTNTTFILILGGLFSEFIGPKEITAKWTCFQRSLVLLTFPDRYDTWMAVWRLRLHTCWCECVSCSLYTSFDLWVGHQHPGDVNSFSSTLTSSNGQWSKGHRWRKESTDISQGLVLQIEWLPCDEHHTGLPWSPNNRKLFGPNWLAVLSHQPTIAGKRRCCKMLIICW